MSSSLAPRIKMVGLADNHTKIPTCKICVCYWLLITTVLDINWWKIVCQVAKAVPENMRRKSPELPIFQHNGQWKCKKSHTSKANNREDNPRNPTLRRVRRWKSCVSWWMALRFLVVSIDLVYRWQLKTGVRGLVGWSIGFVQHHFSGEPRTLDCVCVTMIAAGNGAK